MYYVVCKECGGTIEASPSYLVDGHGEHCPNEGKEKLGYDDVVSGDSWEEWRTLWNRVKELEGD